MHSLKIKNQGSAEIITLDQFELKGITEYELKSSANKQTELTVKMIVDVDEISIQPKSSFQMLAEQLGESVQKVLRKPSEQ